MKRNILWLFSLVVLTVSGSVLGEERGTWAVRVDQDSLAIPHTDQNYTMGVAITYNTNATTSWVDSDPLLPLLDGINNLVSFGQDMKLTVIPSREREFILQDNAFTPQCLHTAAICQSQGQPITQDRPYANLIWTGVSTYGSDHDNQHERAVRTEFDFGIYGTSIGRVVQTKIHERCCKNKIPQEWDTQIGNGGAPTFLYKQTHFYSLTEKEAPVGLKVNYGYWVGWNTWLTAGISAKCCIPNTAWDRAKLEYDASYVLYNQSLQGAWAGTNQVKYFYSQLEPVVTLMHFKFDIVKPDDKDDGFRFTYSQNWKSRELKLGNVEPRHRWGGLEIAYTKGL